MPTLFEEKRVEEQKRIDTEKQRLQENAKNFDKEKNDRIAEILGMIFDGKSSKQMEGKVSLSDKSKITVTLDELKINSEADYIGNEIKPIKIRNCVSEAAEFYDSVFEIAGKEGLNLRDFTIETDNGRFAVYDLVNRELAKLSPTGSVSDKNLEAYTKAYIVHFLLNPSTGLSYNPVEGVSVPCNVPYTAGKKDSVERLNKVFAKEMKRQKTNLEKNLYKTACSLYFYDNLIKNEKMDIFDLDTDMLDDAAEKFDNLFGGKDALCKAYPEDFKVIRTDESGESVAFSVPDVVMNRMREKGIGGGLKKFTNLCKAYILMNVIRKNEEIYYNIDRWTVKNDIPALKENALKEGIVIGGENGIESARQKVTEEMEQLINAIEPTREDYDKMEILSDKGFSDFENGKADLAVVKAAEEEFDRIFSEPIKKDKQFVKHINIFGVEPYNVYDNLVFDDFYPYNKIKDKKGIKDLDSAFKKVCILRALSIGEAVYYTLDKQIRIPSPEMTAEIKDKRFDKTAEYEVGTNLFGELYKLPMNSRERFNLPIDPATFSKEELEEIDKFYDREFGRAEKLFAKEGKDALKYFNMRPEKADKFVNVLTYVENRYADKNYTDEQKKQFARAFILHAAVSPLEKISFEIPSLKDDSDRRIYEFGKPEVPDGYYGAKKSDFWKNNEFDWVKHEMPTEVEVNDAMYENGYSYENFRAMLSVWSIMVDLVVHCEQLAIKNNSDAETEYKKLLSGQDEKNDNAAEPATDFMAKCNAFMNRYFKERLELGDEKAQKAFTEEVNAFLPDFANFVYTIPGINAEMHEKVWEVIPKERIKDEIKPKDKNEVKPEVKEEEKKEEEKPEEKEEEKKEEVKPEAKEEEKVEEVKPVVQEEKKEEVKVEEVKPVEVKKQEGKEWEAYREASKNMATYSLWKNNKIGELDKIINELSAAYPGEAVPAEGSPAKKMFDSIMAVRGVLQKEIPTRRELNQALLDMYLSADAFREEVKPHMKGNNDANMRTWFNASGDCLKIARDTKMTSETISSWIKDSSLRTGDGKTFKDATLPEINERLTQLKAEYADKTDYSADPGVKVFAEAADQNAAKQLKLIIRMGKENGRQFNFNAFAGKTDEYMYPKKNPSTLDLAKEFYIKDLCRQLVSKTCAEKPAMLAELEKRYMNNFKNKAAKLAKDSVFEAYSRQHPTDIHYAWEKLTKDVNEMRVSNRNLLLDAEKQGYAAHVMDGAYTSSNIDGIQCNKLTSPDAAYMKLTNLVLGQILMEPSYEDVAKNMLIGRLSYTDVYQKTFEYLKNQNLIPKEEIIPSTHQERKNLDSVISSGKLRTDVMKNVVSKQKLKKLEVAPAADRSPQAGRQPSGPRK